MSPTFFEMIEKVQKDDSDNHEFKGDWQKKPLSENILFKDVDTIWRELQNTYSENFKSLVFGKLPGSTSVKRALNIVAMRLKEFDKKSQNKSI